MKRMMIFMLALVLGIGVVAGQEREDKRCSKGQKNARKFVKTLDYKFKASNADAKATFLTHIRHNGAVEVKVSNVNPFLYDIEIEGKSVSYNNNAPENLVAAMIPGLPMPKKSAENAASVAQTPKADTKSIMLDGGALSSQAEVDSANAAYEGLQRKQKALVELEKIARDPQLSMDGIVKDKKGWLNEYFHGEASNILVDSDMAVKCWGKWREIALNATQDPEQLKALAAMQAALTKAEYTQLPAQIDGLYHKLDSAAFEHVSIPFRPAHDADELVIHIKISPKASAEDLIGKSVTEYPCTLRVKGGWRLDFSAGVGIGQMPNEEFALVDSGAVLHVVEERSTALSVGAMGLAHFRYRSCGDVTFGVSAGIMYDDSKRLRYLLGGSLMLGHRQRIVLSGGAALGKVQLLSGTQADKTTLNPGTKLLYVDRFRVGGFFGLSYNFGN
jgi:hypothetical protein